MNRLGKNDQDESKNNVNLEINFYSKYALSRRNYLSFFLNNEGAIPWQEKCLR